jgi:pyruvate/2-oxoglutarate dehydrogenase complex dihydrolipoamide acyltransferase (E2) component
VPNFRCHMLDEHRNILFPADIVAETVSAAIQQGFEILESNNRRPLPSRQVHAFEVWDGDGRVFPQPPPKPAKFEELDQRSVSLSANAKALREAAVAARDRSAVLKKMARTTMDAADEYRKLAEAARKRAEAR